jgi:hypothetical protein
MNVATLLHTYQRSVPVGFRPNPAETIEKGIELGADPVQQDLFAITAGIADVKSAGELSELGKSKGVQSWQMGAYAVAGALAGSPTSGGSLIAAVEGLFADPISRGFFALAGGLAGTQATAQIKEVTAGYGQSPAENGLLGVAAAVIGPEGAVEAIQAGLEEGESSREGSLLGLATALAGGAQELKPMVSLARDFASHPELVGTYAVAAALAGEGASSALRMAEDLGENPREKALFAVVGGLVGAERGPGFVRMSRALSPDPDQVGSMAVAAALTGAMTSPEREAAAAAVTLFLEPAEV